MAVFAKISPDNLCSKNGRMTNGPIGKVFLGWLDGATGNRFPKSIFLFETQASWKCKYRDPSAAASSSSTVDVTRGLLGSSQRILPCSTSLLCLKVFNF